MNESQGSTEEIIPVNILKTSSITLGQTVLDCAIAHDEHGKPLRLLSQRKLGAAIGILRKTSSNLGIVQLAIASMSLKDYVTEGLLRYAQAYTWKTTSGMKAKGYRAELLPELCDLYLCARDAGALTLQQSHIAESCYRMMRAFAKLGIVALVDEATGYQEIRAKDDLKQLFDYYLIDVPWDGDTRVLFQKDFWQGAFALYGKTYHPSKRPHLLKGFIARAIYTYCPRPVYDRVKTLNPVKDEAGRRDHLNHEHFTDTAWREQLQKQVQTVMNAGKRIDWNPARREEFWKDLSKMCHPTDIQRVHWQQALEDLGFADLPLFRNL